MKAILRNCALGCAAVALALLGFSPAHTQQLSPKLQNTLGHWQVLNNDGTLGGKVDTYLVDGKLFGKVTAVRPGRTPQDLCDRCSGENKNKPILGMVIMRDFHPEGDDWVGGTVLDPDNGKEYKGKVWSVSEDKLSMRGYIGISLLGRTSNWVRIK